MKNLYNYDDWSDIQEHLLLGEILLQSGRITLENLGLALDIQNFDETQSRARLGDVLLSMKVVLKEEVDSALSLQKLIDNKLEQIGGNGDT